MVGGMGVAVAVDVGIEWPARCHQQAPSLLERVASGDERAASGWGLHHDRGCAQTADDAIAAREGALGGTNAWGQLADDRALSGDAPGKASIRGRTRAIDARADHGDLLG